MLQTKRVYMREWLDSDAEQVYELAKDPDIGYRCGFPAHTSVENSLDVIRNVLRQPECYAIVEKGTDRLIGSIQLILGKASRISAADDECELGFWIGRPFWGQGLLPEAATELIRHGFEELNMKKIWCAYYVGNEQSKRAQEKLGFIYQRTEYDVMLKLLGEKRNENINLLTKEGFYARRILK